MFKIKSKNKAFSLVETLVTLLVFGILLAMLSQVLILNLKVSRKVSARTRIREELSELTGLLQRDLRNADFVDLNLCGNNVTGFPPIPNTQINGCHMYHTNDFMWVSSAHPNCPTGKICKLDFNNPNNILFQTSDILKVTNLTFDKVIYDPNNAKATMIVTIFAEANNPNWDVTNQVRQITIATRNF